MASTKRRSDSLMLLAIDDVSIPFRRNLGMYLSKPTVRPEPVLRASEFGSGAPDDWAAHFYGTVLQDGGKFRMWYYACHWGKNPDWPPQMMQQVVKKPTWAHVEFEGFEGPICYAESDDGITWTKPQLWQVLFKGSHANNAIALPHTIVAGVDVVKDEDDPDPARRYKMAYEFFPDQAEPHIDEYGWRPTIGLAVSPDGLKWTMSSIPFKDQFIEQCSMIHHDRQFIVHFQVMDIWAGWCAEGGTKCGRVGVAHTTYDWDHWPDTAAEAFALAEPEDPKLRGMSGPYDQVHLGVGAASFGNVCVGVFGLWHNADFDKDFDAISGDFGLLVSNDGVKFREPVKGHRFLRRTESPATPVPGKDFHTVLCQGNGILNVGDETRIYHGRWRNAGGPGKEELFRYATGEVALATLPRDRWGALGLHPDAKNGSLWTAPIALERGQSIVLNADGTRSMRVELSDERFKLLPEFSGEKAGTVGPDGLDCAVTWAGSDVSTLAGTSVRIRVSMARGEHPDPRVFAIYIRNAPAK